MGDQGKAVHAQMALALEIGQEHLTQFIHAVIFHLLISSNLFSIIVLESGAALPPRIQSAFLWSDQKVNLSANH